MEDIVGLIVMALIMIGGAVASANKKKKAREAAERDLQRRQQVGEVAEQEQERFGRWSLEEVLAELSDQSAGSDRKTSDSPVYDHPAEDYYDRQMAALEMDGRFAFDSATNRSVTDRLATERFTPPAAAATKAAITGRVAVAETVPEKPEEIDYDGFLTNFDLRRAVIESEILKPKFEQY